VKAGELLFLRLSVCVNAVTPLRCRLCRAQHPGCHRRRRLRQGAVTNQENGDVIGLARAASKRFDRLYGANSRVTGNPEVDPHSGRIAPEKRDYR